MQSIDEVPPTQRYYPYGEQRGTSQAATDYRYTGQREEDEIGLYYYDARWYDPALGRFVQPDPIVPQPGNAQALNRYSYVLNNPLRYIDASGFDPGVPGAIADFAYGFISQWGYNNLWMAPAAQQSLAVQGSASREELAGRFAANVASMAQSVMEVGSGGSMMLGGGGAAVATAPSGVGVVGGGAVMVAGGVVVAHGAGVGITGAVQNGPLIAQWRFSTGSGSRSRLPMTREQADYALTDMNKEGGHAVRYFLDEGVIPKRGSLESQVGQFQEIARPILMDPIHVFPWTLQGNQPATGYLGMYNGELRVVFVARGGNLDGKVLTAWTPRPSSVKQWMAR